ncbi:MAG: thioredoxin-disulfide reductase [Ignavibacteriae bacterium HGW-Ignavibacteriae-4]|nr:MAG: thioredoxin-disulfide reductase [Ignavibacteriae bacterium HGW-Ignavibacteriae-4]
MSTHHQVIIIGSGPAGLTAALYASRANLEVVVFEGMQPGGQLTITTEVENYPGFVNGIQGPEMMDILRKQAQRFEAKSIFETVKKVDFSERPFKMTTEKGDYTADAVIISTGATAKLLNIPSEQTYWGSGISACATCDGFFFNGEKNLFIIGGGDTAMEEALFLTKYGQKVTVVNRSENYRASKIMLERAKNHPKIEFIENVVVDEYIGETTNGIKKLTGLNLKDVNTGEVTFHEGGGAFIAIGHTPNTDIFENIIDMNEVGYIETKGKSTYTNIEGVFACGDAQDNVYRQAVTAAGTGCMAAIDAERWLAEQE